MVRTTVEPSAKQWTIEDYHRLIATGLFAPGDRAELLDGQILTRVPQEPPHASHTSSFSNDLVVRFAGKAWVRAQLPITLPPNSEPEPDIALVRIDENRYRDRHPSPDDIFLLIEISDSTLRYDRDRKAKIYARSRIRDYWIVNINQQQVIVLRDPQGDTYQSEQILTVQDAIAPLAFPDITIQLQELL